MNHIEIASKLYKAREHHDNCKALSAEAYREVQALNGKLMDAMADEGLKAFTLEDGTSVSTKRHFSISVTKDNQDLIRDWLMSTYGDDSDFVIEKLSKEILVSTIKAEIEDGKKYATDFPEFFKLKTSDIIQVNGWKDRNKNG